MMEMNEKMTKVYTIEVQFYNEVKEEADILRYVAFVKDISTIEEMARKECGEHYMGIRGIQLMDDFIPLF